MERSPTILFDGVCNFCNGSVRFLVRQDHRAVLRFAALQSAAGQRLLEAQGLSQTDFNSFLFLENGRLYQKSTAALKVAKHLPWYWQWTRIFWVMPRLVRDGLYDLLARHRYRWFGKKGECMIPTPEVRRRFLS